MNTIKDFYILLFGFNDKNFVDIKHILNKPKNMSYLLELNDSRYLDKIYVEFQRNQKSEFGRWYNIDSIKYGTKEEFFVKRI